MESPRPTRLTCAWRGLLIAVVAGGILLFGFNQGRALLNPDRALPSGPPRITAAMPFEPLPGSRLLRSCEVTFNGQKSGFAQYRSGHSAEEVVAQFEDRYGEPVADAPPTEGTMVRLVTPAYAMAGAVDEGGQTLGLVAFQERQGGCTYFVGRAARRPEGWRHDDVPGEEVRGIPRPLRSKRILCIDGLGGIPSRLLVYEGWGAVSDTVELFAQAMPKAGWTRNAEVEEVIQKRLPGVMLSFLKGTQRAMIYIEREKASNTVRTAVVYSIKGWLPPDTGL